MNNQHSNSVMRGVGNIRQWQWLLAANQLVNYAVHSPTRNIYNRDTKDYEQVLTPEAEALQKLDTDNPFYILNGYIKQANDDILASIQGEKGRVDWSLIRKIEALLDVKKVMPIILVASKGERPVLLASKVRHPNWDEHITAYEYTGDTPDNSRFGYKRSWKSTKKLKVDTATYYMNWRTKNASAIHSFNEHNNALKASLETDAMKYDLKNYTESLTGLTKELNAYNDTLEEDLRKYALERQWWDTRPEHLTGAGEPYIDNLMRDPMQKVERLTKQIEDVTNRIADIQVKLSLRGVSA